VNNSLRIAIAHDYLNQMGGAEKCVEVMHDIFPQAPVYTSIYNPDVMDSCFSKMDLRLSFMQKLPLIQKCFRYYLPLYPFAFQHFDFGSYDVVLSSSSAFAKGIHTNSKTCHICYCYTPMRFAWNYHSYVERERLGLAARMILPGIIAPLKYWNRKNSPKVDYFIAISQAVAERIRKHYQRDSKIIYPPVNTKHFTPAHDSIGDYFLVVSRLIPYKRIDLVVEAFNQTGLPLKIPGIFAFLTSGIYCLP
jgi:glycosyltransferase involved in cell wall biosynthesis